MQERSGCVFPVFDLWKFWDYPGMHLICANEMDAAKLGRLRQEEVHDVFDVVHSVYRKDRKHLSSNLRDVSFEVVAYVAATITGTTKQFEKVLEEAHECGKERADMGGALDGPVGYLMLPNPRAYIIFIGLRLIFFRYLFYSNIIKSKFPLNLYIFLNFFKKQLIFFTFLFTIKSGRVIL